MTKLGLYSTVGIMMLGNYMCRSSVSIDSFLAQKYDQRALTLRFYQCGHAEHENEVALFKNMTATVVQKYCISFPHDCCLENWNNTADLLAMTDNLVVLARDFPIKEFMTIKIRFTVLYPKPALPRILDRQHCHFRPKTFDPDLLRSIFMWYKISIKDYAGWELIEEFPRTKVQQYMDLLMLPAIIFFLIFVIASFKIYSRYEKVKRAYGICLKRSNYRKYQKRSQSHQDSIPLKQSASFSSNNEGAVVGNVVQIPFIVTSGTLPKNFPQENDNSLPPVRGRHRSVPPHKKSVEQRAKPRSKSALDHGKRSRGRRTRSKSRKCRVAPEPMNSDEGLLTSYLGECKNGSVSNTSDSAEKNCIF